MEGYLARDPGERAMSHFVSMREITALNVADNFTSSLKWRDEKWWMNKRRMMRTEWLSSIHVRCFLSVSTVEREDPED